MKEIKIVIGANYGDEGKGLATDFFAKESKIKNKNTVVVLHNGGFQRGHTVVHNNIRHVFHCFSSGTFQKATTYYDKEFILNPIFFREEYLKLEKLGFTPKIICNPLCRITTPLDMMINQIVEISRGINRHGSCGYGILETIKRNEKIPLITSHNLKINLEKFIYYIYQEIRNDYIFNRLEDLGVKNVAISTIKQIMDNSILAKYIEDLEFMLEHITIKENTVLSEFDTIIFEAGQGLLLDQKNINKTKHLTPSNTGSQNPINTIKELNILGFLKEFSLETYYVSRTYLTRHGSGEFDLECNKEDINKYMIDKTNIINDFQGELRYGYIDINELNERINEDFCEEYNNRKYLFITHLNETNNKFITKNGLIPISNLNNIKYISNIETNILRIK